MVGLENPVHLVFIAVVALVVLGPRRLPELARALGKGLREFREAISVDEIRDVHDTVRHGAVHEPVRQEAHAEPAAPAASQPADGEVPGAPAGAAPSQPPPPDTVAHAAGAHGQEPPAAV